MMNDESKNEKKLNSEFHTMFIEDISQSTDLIDEVNKTYKISPAHKKYRVFVDLFMEAERGLHEMFNTLWNADTNDKLELRINSWGGLINEGQNFYNVIKNKFNGRTTTVLDNAAYSMGAIIFCAGDERICMEHCDLMFHDYSGGSFGKGGEIESKVKHKAKHLRNFFKKIILDPGFLSQDEFNKMLIGQDYWMDTPELCKRGIATHVMVDGHTVKASDYYKFFKGKITKDELLTIGD